MSDRMEFKLLVSKSMGSRPEALFDFLDLLATECIEIEGHVLENWQDTKTARAWAKAGRQIEQTLYRVQETLNAIGVYAKR